MPTTTLGVIIDGTKLSQIFGVINATLGDFKILFYLLMGWVIGFWIIEFVLHLVRLKNENRAGQMMLDEQKEKTINDDFSSSYYDDDEDDDDDDEE